MNKGYLILLFFFFSVASFALTETKGSTTSFYASSHECYMMNDQTLLHRTGDITEPAGELVRFPNGTVVTSTGLLTFHDDSSRTLTSGESISPKGKLEKCEKMHGFP